MMLSQLYESELAEPDPCFPPNSRSRVKRNIALYAEMLGYPDPGPCRPVVYVRTRADLSAFIRAHAPTHLAKSTIKNCYNDLAKLIESGRARGWLAPPASPFYPWPQPNRQIPSPLGKRKVLHLGVFDDRPKEHHTRYTLDAFPPLLGAEMYTYLYWSSHLDEPHPVLGRPPKRIHKNERSVAAIARHWRRIAGYAVHVEGMDADALTLAQLCEPAFAERFKEFILRRSGACTLNVTNLLTDLKTVARYWLQDDAAVKGLLRIFQELPRTQAVCEKEDRWLDLEDIDRIGQSRHPANPRRRELPPTHYQSWLFNHLDDPERYQPYPGWSFKIIAMWVGLSLMFRLWCHRPLRSRQIS